MWIRPRAIDMRGAIAEEAKVFFGRPITIDERALQALEVVTRKGRTATQGHLWASLNRSFPALAQLYGQLGFELFDKLSDYWPNEVWKLHEGKHYRPSWTELFREIFSIVDRVGGNHSPTETRFAVEVSGRVSSIDLTTTVIESGWISKLYHRRATNLVLRGLERGAGLDETRFWDWPAEEFTRRVKGILRGIQQADQSFGAQQFILSHDGTRYRIRPFGYFGSYQLQEEPLEDGSLWIARGNVVQPLERFTPSAIDHLESLINSGAEEAAFQAFFEANPEFLLALGDYVTLHPQLVLSGDDGSLVPDFFLEKMNSDFVDICDLKRPTAELVRLQRNRVRFRDTLMEAVAQLETYRDWFEDRVHRRAFLELYGLKAYRPRIVIIIGRRQSFPDEVTRIRLESKLPSWIVLRTYDDVLDKAQQWRSFFFT